MIYYFSNSEFNPGHCNFLTHASHSRKTYVSLAIAQTDEKRAFTFLATTTQNIVIVSLVFTSKLAATCNQKAPAKHI